MPAFSKKEAIGFGWKKFKENWKFLVSAVFISQAVSFVPTVFNFFFKSETLAFLIFTLIFSLIIWLVKTVIDMGLLRMSLKIHDGQATSLQDLFIIQNLVKYILASMLYGLITLIGIVLLVVPGIIWSIKFQFYSYLVVEKGLGPVEALKASWEMTKGVKWNLFLFGVLLGLINVLGVLALFLGLFITIPATILAQVYVYKKLSN